VEEGSSRSGLAQNPSMPRARRCAANSACTPEGTAYSLESLCSVASIGSSIDNSCANRATYNPARSSTAPIVRRPCYSSQEAMPQVCAQSGERSRFFNWEPAANVGARSRSRSRIAKLVLPTRHWRTSQPVAICRQGLNFCAQPCACVGSIQQHRTGREGSNIMPRQWRFSPMREVPTAPTASGMCCLRPTAGSASRPLRNYWPAGHRADRTARWWVVSLHRLLAGAGAGLCKASPGRVRDSDRFGYRTLRVAVNSGDKGPSNS
jgi:hypothetical protein